MSLLSIGKACHTCSTIDFLPFTCPSCTYDFCRAHIQGHGCPTSSPSAVGEIERNALAGPSSFARKVTCDVAGCERPRIEAIAGIAPEQGEGVARQVRCDVCKGGFCTSHRSQKSHSCAGPLEVNAIQDAFQERRAKAKEMIAQKFPDLKPRTRPPPKEEKEPTGLGLRPKAASPERIPPSLQVAPIPSSSTTTAASASTLTMKTKADKMYEIEMRKLRSLAKPLEPKMDAGGERRFFQWSLGTKGEIEEWEKGKGFDKTKKVDKVWVPLTTPVGKILDIMIIQSKVGRPVDQNPASIYSIICLSDKPSTGRSILPMKNDQPASNLIEGSTLILVKGWDV